MGNRIPDQAFLAYDPALHYSCVPFPGFSVPLMEVEAESMARWVRLYMPRGEKGRFWESFEEQWQFVIVLPFLTQYTLQESPHEEVWLHMMRYIMNGLIHCSVSVMTSPTQSPPVRLFPYQGRIQTSTCPNSPAFNLPRYDILGGGVSDDFRLDFASSGPFKAFKGTGIESYSDLSMLLLARPLPSAQIPVTATLKNKARERYQNALEEDRYTRESSSIPWLIFCNVSDTQEHQDEKMKEVFAGAGGLTWACASPLTGPFFFPRGGFVASSPVFSPREPPSLSQISINEEHSYAWDIISTIIYYSCNRSIPDLILVSDIRHRFAEYWRKRREILHALDWAEAWGRSPAVYLVWRDLAYVENKKANAVSLYIEESYKRSGKLISKALKRMDEAEAHARLCLREGLFWVYFVESLCIGAVSLISISIVMWLLREPKRDLKPEAETTRQD
jgi:hypothetical protein